MMIGNSIKEYKVQITSLLHETTCALLAARLVMREEKKPRYNNKVLSKHFH